MTQATTTRATAATFKALKCKECGEEYELKASHVCEFCFGPLVTYDYEPPTVTRESIQAGPHSIWRYRPSCLSPLTPQS